MPTSLIDADSLLAIDVGEVHTRALLFDVVDGRYRFLAGGTAPSTHNAPFRDAGEGIRQAIERLEAITGRTLVGADERLITPGAPDGSGVDTVAATVSGGPPLKVALVGLLEDISVESLRRLATTTYAQVVETIALNDRRKTEERIDALLRARPNLILAGGGTEGGAAQSVLRLLDSVGLAAYLLPQDGRPEVLFAGNQALEVEVKSSLGRLGGLHFAPNLRPALDRENLDSAQVQLAERYRAVRCRQISGLSELDGLAGGGLLPTATAFGRIVRYFSKIYEARPDRGVLGVDLGASALTVAAAYAGDMRLGVFPHLGLGRGLGDLLEHTSLQDLQRWMPMELPSGYIQEYLVNKSLYPASVPATPEDLAIEQAVARVAIGRAVRQVAAGLPPQLQRTSPELLPWFEPILFSGSLFTRAPSVGQALLVLLDALQPTGITTFYLDQHHVIPAVGAAAATNPLLTVQVLESNLQLLGMVISPVGSAKPGTPVLRLKMTYENGSTTTLDVKFGSLEVLPLPQGQRAQIQIQPLHRFDVGIGGPGRGGTASVTGGALGVIVDARGRPFHLPEDDGRRRELLKKWLWTLGG